MSRVLRRSLRRVVTREELWNGNREHWSNLCSCNPEKSIIAWSATRHRVSRQRYAEAEQDPRWARLRFVRLRSQRDADAFLGRSGGPRRRRGCREEENMDLELGGKIVLITGGTDGLGLALATELAIEGAAVSGVRGATRSDCKRPRGSSRRWVATSWRNALTCRPRLI